MSILSSTNSGFYKELTHNVLVRRFKLVHQKHVVFHRKNQEYNYYSIDNDARMQGRFIYSTSKNEFYARIMILGYTFFFKLHTINDAKIIIDFCKNYHKIVEGINWEIKDDKELEKIAEVKELFKHFEKRLI